VTTSASIRAFVVFGHLLMANIWLQLYRFYFEVAYDDRSWQSLFGISIPIVSYVWDLVLPRAEVSKPEYLLWCLYFLKRYQSSYAAHCTFRVSERTYRDNVWKVMFALDRHLHSINFNTRVHDADPLGCYLCVDSKLCPVQTDRTDWVTQKLWFDGYHKKHGMKYQIAVHVFTGRIHHFVGGVFGSVADITLLRQSQLLDRLQDGERIYADKGYVGIPDTVLTPYKGRSATLPLWKRMWNEYINKHRVIVENVLGRLCKFECVHQPWRHSIALHPVMMNVCTQLTDLDILFFPVRNDIYEDPVHRWSD